MYLLDTNIISELRKVTVGTAHASVIASARRTQTADMYLSVITPTETEIDILSLERRDPIQRRRSANGLMNRFWRLFRIGCCQSTPPWLGAPQRCMFQIGSRSVMRS